MAETPSTMIALGSRAPAFLLPDTVSSGEVSLADAAGEKGTLVAFICNHCPYVTHIISSLSKAVHDFSAVGVATILISSNDAQSYPQDGPENMTKFAALNNISCPYLYDETQEVARLYNAACTPDFFLYDSAMTLVYRGQYDAARPGNGVGVSGVDLRAAVSALAKGEAISPNQMASMGCNIKWR